MRGSFTATTRSRAATASTALISQRSGPLTASPKGEADAIAKKLIWRGCEPPSLPPRGKAAPQGRMRGELAATGRKRVIVARLPLISQRSGPLTASVSALRAASGGCASTRACGRSPAGEGGRVYGKAAPTALQKTFQIPLTRPCFYDKLSLVKKAATGSRPSAHLEGLQKPRVIP